GGGQAVRQVVLGHVEVGVAAVGGLVVGLGQEVHRLRFAVGGEAQGQQEVDGLLGLVGVDEVVGITQAERRAVREQLHGGGVGGDAAGMLPAWISASARPMRKATTSSYCVARSRMAFTASW